jgi:RNA polymerase sigma factor (sigma-70 family)
MTHEELFNHLRKKYHDYVNYTLFYHKFELELRKDLTQDYFADIWRRILRGDIVPGDQFEAWKMKLYLKGSIKDFCIKQNAVKRQAQNRAISLTAPVSHSNESLLVDSVQDHNCPDSDAMLLKKERNGMLVKALSTLNKKDREIIHKYYWEGKKLHDIADEYGVSKQRIGQKIEAINKKLKKYLPDYDYFRLNS